MRQSTSDSRAPFRAVIVFVFAVVVGLSVFSHPASAQPPEPGMREIEAFPGLRLQVPSRWAERQSQGQVFVAAESTRPSAPIMAVTVFDNTENLSAQQFLQNFITQLRTAHGVQGQIIDSGEVRGTNVLGRRVAVQTTLSQATVHDHLYVAMPTPGTGIFIQFSFPADRAADIAPLASRVFASVTFSTSNTPPVGSGEFSSERNGFRFAVPDGFNAVEAQNGGIAVRGALGIIEIIPSPELAATPADQRAIRFLQRILQGGNAPQLQPENAIDSRYGQFPVGRFEGQVSGQPRIIFVSSIVIGDQAWGTIGVCTAGDIGRFLPLFRATLTSIIALRDLAAPQPGPSPTASTPDAPVRVMALGLAAAPLREMAAAAVSRTVPKLAVEFRHADDVERAIGDFRDEAVDVVAVVGRPSDLTALGDRMEAELGARPVMVVIGVQGVIAVVHRDCPVQQISREQFAHLLGTTDGSGVASAPSIRTWNELDPQACPPTSRYGAARLRAIGPAADSPLTARAQRVLFSEATTDRIVLRAEPVTGAMQRAMAVLNEPFSLGIVEAGWGSGQLPALKVAPTANAPGVAPTLDTMISGEYPLTEQLVLFVRPKAGPSADLYVQSALSSAGQRHLAGPNFGWLPLTAQLRRAALTQFAEARRDEQRR